MFTKSMQEYITKMTTASSEEDLDYLLLLMAPSDDRDEMGEVYQNTLGYDPINYFDEKYITKSFEDIMENAPISIKESLLAEKDKIIGKVIDKKKLEIDSMLLNILVKEIFEETGWIPFELEGDGWLEDEDEDDDIIEEFEDEDDEEDFD